MVPTIRLTDAEKASDELKLDSLLLARHLMSSQGVLLIENAFEPDLIRDMAKVFEKEYLPQIQERQSTKTLEVGDKRMMINVLMEGIFASPKIYANPFVLPIVQAVMGANSVLGSLGAVASLPGAQDQHIHRDHPMLFMDEQLDTSVPAFSINVMVPLIELNDVHGTTRVWPGTHRVWHDEPAKEMPSFRPLAPLGSCFLMDYRLMHGGTANVSAVPRPIVYVIYNRPWFKDYVNYNRVRELSISREGLANVPPDLRHWFISAIEP